MFNVYQLDSKSNTVELVPNEEEPDDEEDNAVIDDGEEDTDSGLYDSYDNEEVVEEEAADSDWIIGGDVPAVDNSAIANAIDKNTKSRVKSSYTAFLIAGLIGAITLTVTIVIAVSYMASNREKDKRRRDDI